jgi:hypothetical protein
MDEAVLRAMAKWPDVPAVFGWLALDARGRWLIRGEPVANPLLNDFIGRNYAADPHGRWYFQNGPQRVFVALACTPWVLRVDTAGRVHTHTGIAAAEIRGAWMDRAGRMILNCEHGAGLVDDRDSETISGLIVDANGSATDEDALIESLDRIQAGASAPVRLECAGTIVPIEPIAADQVPVTLGFVADPQPLPGERGAS